MHRLAYEVRAVFIPPQHCLDPLEGASGEASLHVCDDSASFSRKRSWRPSTTSGHYEYGSGGVPLLGLVVRLPDDPTPSDDTLVNFRTCSNKTIEVVFKLLKPVARKCQPRKNPGDIFAAETLAPLTKAESKPGNPMIKFQGQLIDLTEVPKTYTHGVENAKPGDWVGYAVTVKDGSKRAIFFSPPPPI